MPELPEVETVRRGLEERILGLCIREVEVLCEKSFVGEVSEVVGREVVALRRFGKALIIDLTGGVSMMVHLRMTGQLIFDGAEREKDIEFGAQTKVRHAKEARGELRRTGVEAGLDREIGGRQRYAAGHPSENFVASLPNKQTRVVFRFVGKDGITGKVKVVSSFGEDRESTRESEVVGKFEGESEVVENSDRVVEKSEITGVLREDIGVLYFNDQRKFGFVKVLRTEEVEKEPFVAKLAKEPWEMTPGEFYEALQRHPRSAIKAVILDQGVIAGLGNIYADESLFMSKIHPERKAGSLTEEEAEKLLLAAREVMTRSIESGGSTMATYVKADGTRGNYLEKFAQVFRKEGQPCPRCGAEIVKIRVAGRGTHICPECQKIGETDD